MADDEHEFDFEEALEPVSGSKDRFELPPDLPAEVIGQQPGNFKKNYRQTVCTYWLRGLCMKGEQCGFLHQFDPQRMPVCRTLLKYGECKEIDCPFKHSMEEVKECNMYKLGFCIYGPTCRYKHIKSTGPPPDPSEVEAAKPREHRNINLVVNSVNPGVATFDRPYNKRPRYNPALPSPSGGGMDQDDVLALMPDDHDSNGGAQQQQQQLPGPPRGPQPPAGPPPAGPQPPSGPPPPAMGGFGPGRPDEGFGAGFSGGRGGYGGRGGGGRFGEQQQQQQQHQQQFGRGGPRPPQQQMGVPRGFPGAVMMATYAPGAANMQAFPGAPPPQQQQRQQQHWQQQPPQQRQQSNGGGW